ncbi:GDSL-type esterase/lipase family protein [Spirilliplanes yamanashiensis]|uniref:SGNH hydrolase n=1 Tax=Spirilliplanes yamanashiensis TaxID=42233 RepID=A0A8J3YC39_9ACTN|nr:GDSL-type esterase/lipase family protein [Spirilliplanes yamanashiensis]MDP9816311.1 lysophospholipase L1-like esterase [Spirilliplanes yamanashiensis]GIJ05838.1 SGNH hydrolase [Spirilliplanes yamanashiensis]
MGLRRVVVMTVAALLGAVAVATQYNRPGPSPSAAAVPAPPQWVGAWAAPMSDGDRGDFGDGPYTVRNVVRLSVGGSAVRLRLSNAFGGDEAEFGPVTVALADPQGAGGLGGPAAPVTFGGNLTVDVPDGGSVVSDPVPFEVADGATLAVSVHVPDPPPRASRHILALRTQYAAEGDHAADESSDAFDRTSTSWWYLTGVDVAGSGATGTVVAFGDSITDGHGSTFGKDRRWPDVLADRLEAAPQRLAVVNSGISGNLLLPDADDADWGDGEGEGDGEERVESGDGDVAESARAAAGDDKRGRPGVDRAERDIAEPPATRTVVLMLGINDIRHTDEPDAADVWAGYERIVAAAHGQGVRVIGSTLLPIGGTDLWTEERERVREQVNERIRAGELFDGFVDADAAVRDPDDPSRMRDGLHTGDWLHPSDAGYRAIADAIDLSIL